MKKRIKIQGIAVFLAFVLAILFSKILFPSWKHAPFDKFFDAVGIAIILFGFLFRISARGYKQEKSVESKKLITTGPYALLRNPMYFGSILIGTGIIIVLFNGWLLIPSLIISLSILIPQIYKEEEKLKKQFGEVYINYCKNTPRYFPKFSNLFKLDFREHLPLKWLWVKREFISLFLVVIGIIAIEMWEDVKLFGRAEYFKELLELILFFSSFIIILKLFYGKNLSRKD